MIKQPQCIEILAPAGTMDSLCAAVIGGADAVYLGLEHFGARSKAASFDLDTLANALEYAHLFQTKVYVTVNTLLKDNEIGQAISMVLQAHDLGADAFIVQDLGLVQSLLHARKDLILHASTQMGIHNAYGAKAAQDLGIRRIVLSRETTLDDIHTIKKFTDIELEYFALGALCTCFSGNCYMGGILTGYSGNRGRCMQLCRKPYKIDAKTGYFLSACDLILLKDLPDLIGAGIQSFKIEGRLRRPEYVGEAVRVLRRTLLEGYHTEDEQHLKRLYNRGNGCGGFVRQATPSVIYDKMPNHMGVPVGTCEKVCSGIAFTDYWFHKGDGLKFLRDGLEVGHALVPKDGYTTAYVGDVRKGDIVCITTDIRRNQAIANRERKLWFDAKVTMRPETRSTVSIKCCGVEIDYMDTHIPQPARSAPILNKDITDCMQKTGDTFFACAHCTSDIDGQIFLPKAALNDMRRNALAALKTALLHRSQLAQKQLREEQSNKSALSVGFLQKLKPIETKGKHFLLQIDDIDRFAPETLSPYDYLIINPKDYTVSLQKYANLGERFLLNLPVIARTDDLVVLEQIIREDIFYGYVINNLYAAELTYGKHVLMGYPMNALNSELRFPRILSVEADYLPQKEDYVFVYGHIPLMTFAHCPRKSYGQICKDCKGEDVSLQDEKGTRFVLRRQKIRHCYHQCMSAHRNAMKSKGFSAKNYFVDATMVTDAQLAGIHANLFGKKNLKTDQNPQGKGKFVLY